MSEIKVQVVRPDTGEASFRPPQLPDFNQRAAELGDALNDIAEQLGKRLGELESEAEARWGLDQVTLTFSLDLQAEAGVILARASSKAGFQAALTWNRAQRSAAA